MRPERRVGFTRKTLLWLFLASMPTLSAQQQQQDPTTLNGGSVLAMAGDGCVALAVDKRFGSGLQVWQSTENETHAQC